MPSGRERRWLRCALEQVDPRLRLEQQRAACLDHVRVSAAANDAAARARVEARRAIGERYNGCGPVRIGHVHDNAEDIGQVCGGSEPDDDRIDGQDLAA